MHRYKVKLFICKEFMIPLNKKGRKVKCQCQELNSGPVYNIHLINKCDTVVLYNFIIFSV